VSRIFLVRHGERSGDKNRLIGRGAGYPLTTRGQTQARALASWAATQRIACVYTSPRERCLETARLLNEAAQAPIEVSNALDEFDFGAWTGRTISDLKGDEQWYRFNSERSAVGAPQGESMAEVQRRIVVALKHWAEVHALANIVAVSHAEPIRAALLYFMDRSLEAWSELEIGEASVSVIEYNQSEFTVAEINKPPPGSADLLVRSHNPREAHIP